MYGGKSMRVQPYIKNYRQIMNAENTENSLSQGRVHQLIIQYQMVNPDNTHTINIIETE